MSNVKKFMVPFPSKTHTGSHEYSKSQRSEISFTSEFHGPTKSVITNSKSITATNTNIETHRDQSLVGFHSLIHKSTSDLQDTWQGSNLLCTKARDLIHTFAFLLQNLYLWCTKRYALLFPLVCQQFSYPSLIKQIQIKQSLSLLKVWRRIF